jgi:hypothetical protein
MTRLSSAFYWRSKIFLALITIFMWASTLLAGGIESVFENAGTKWTSERYNFAPPRFVNNEIGKGYEFNCDFSLADPGYPRCIWDAKLPTPADLSKSASIIMNVRFSNPDSVKFFCFYLKSNGKWHLSKYYDALTEGMNSVVFQLADYRLEGTANPGGQESLNNVDEIRINVFPKDALKTKPTLATVTGVHVSQTKIDGYASLPLFQIPEADKDLKRANRRDAAGHLLESRVIHDMGSMFLKEGADAVIDKLKRAGFNVYILTAWHGRGAIYRSKTEKVEPRFAGNFQVTADPTAEMIKKAHAAGIQVYLQFCVAYRGEPDPHPEFSKDGLPMEGGYLTPYDLQDPAFRDFIVKVIVDAVSDYDVDGVTLDYIRAIGGVSFSKIAHELYRKKYNANLDELKDAKSPELEKRLLEWQEAAVSDVVRRVSEGVRKVKPKVIITADGHLLPKPQLAKEGNNAWIWLEKKWVDIVFNMDYSWRPDFQKFEDAAKGSGSPKQCVMMLGTYDTEGNKSFSRNAGQLARLTDYSLKKYPDYGIGFFDYGTLSDEQVKAFRDGPFKEDAVPSWPSR